jgi:D-sedoheptulose 7-phosphate isomerase
MLPKAMADPRHDAALAYLRRSQQTLERAATDAAFVDAIVAIAGRIAASLKSGGKVLLAGNGGSASDAQHIAAELVGRLVDDRAPLAAIALTTDTSALTAIGNDYGFEQVFARQLRALGKKGDVFIAISTSGRSPNVIAALQAARELGLVTVGFGKTGPAPMLALCDVVLAAPSEETAQTQQLHITAAHAICHLVERELFGAGRI